MRAIDTTYPNSVIRHLAVAGSGRVFAAAEYRQWVSIWDVETGECRIEFETVLDPGGRRLVLNRDGSICVAGAYQRYGIRGYSTANGSEIWQRKDLKGVQKITFSETDNVVYCGFERGPCHVLNVDDGTTKTTLRGTRAVYPDSLQSRLFVDKRVPQVLDVDGDRVFSIERETFAILDVAFSADFVGVSESGGGVRFFTYPEGKEVWRFQPAKGCHVLKLEYCEKEGRFKGVEWAYKSGGSKKLLNLVPEDARSNAIATLRGCCTKQEFGKQGEFLLTSDGLFVDSVSGEAERRFDFPSVKKLARE